MLLRLVRKSSSRTRRPSPLFRLLLVLICCLAPAAAQEQVRLEVITDKPALVYLDDTLLGPSGQVLTADVSDYANRGRARFDLRVVAEGFVPRLYQTEVELPQVGVQRLKVPLVPFFRTFRLTTEPPDADVSVDGDYTGKVVELDAKESLHGRFFIPRTLQVTLKAPGYETRDIELPPEVWETGAYGETLKLVPSPGLGPWWERTRRERPWLLMLLALVPAAAALVAQRLGRYRDRLRRAEQLDGLRADATDPLIGKQLGHYWLAELVASGGMGDVYRGLPHPTLDPEQAVAVKVLRKVVSEDEEFRQRFYREAKVSTSLVHPNIVFTHDWGEQDGLLFLVMELLRGPTLRERLRPDLPVSEVVDLLKQVAAAVHYAHGRGVVHRDLKPENVMLHNECVKVMDFGLARSHDTKTLTASGNVLGTPAYLAPEQAQGLTDERSDQYSLGVMTFELATGRLPFEGSDPIALIMAHLQETPPSPRALRPGLPEELEALILRMLAKDPDDRFESLEAVLRTLDTIPCGPGSTGPGTR